MIRYFSAIFLALVPIVAIAQDANECQNYKTQKGIEFTFKTDDLYKQYGFQMFHETPSGYKSMPYESLAGHKGKVIGGEPGPYGIAYYHHVLVDDCRTVYWYDTDQQLEPDDALSAGITFIDRPPTKWVISQSTDRMTDAKSCRVTPESDMPYPMFFYHSQEGFSVQVVGGDFPGRPTTFRVDKNKAISEIEGLSGAHAQALAAQIRSGGKQLLVGSYGWPNDYEVLKEFNLDGLSEQLDQCKALIR
jgi:hypothetical protein